MLWIWVSLPKSLVLLSDNAGHTFYILNSSCALVVLLFSSTFVVLHGSSKKVVLVDYYYSVDSHRLSLY